jgi:hypothetical protein
MAPMDVANAVLGDDLFTDLITNPEFVHRLLAFLTKAVDWYYRRMRSWADQYEGGNFMFYHNSWMGPDAVGHMTNDAAMLCAPRIYDQFGYPYESQLAAGFGPALYHVHNQKMHFVPKVAQLPHLALLEVTNDPKTTSALDDLPRVLANTGQANLMLTGSSDQVRAHMDELKERNVLLVVTCADRADAKDIIEFVRAHSQPFGA